MVASAKNFHYHRPLFTFSILSSCLTFTLVVASMIQTSLGWRSGNTIIGNMKTSSSVEQRLSTSTKELLDHERVDIAIVGGGLAGLALAIGIATNVPDLSVALIEKRDFSQAGATFGLAPNGAKALKELCDDEFVQSLQKQGVDLTELEDMPVTMLTWWIVRDHLLNRAMDLSNRYQSRLQIYRNLELEDIERPNESDDNLKVAELKFCNSDFKIEASLIVGADGVQSRVRELIGMPPAIDTGRTLYRGSVIIDKSTPPCVSSLLSKGTTPFFLQNHGSSFFVFNHDNDIHPGLLLWGINTPIEVNDEGDMIECLLDLFKESLSSSTRSQDKNIASELLHRTKPSIQRSKYLVQDMSDKVLPDGGGWGGGKRVTLIGDAAHACRATDGQGGNMAFEDCAILCRRLSEVTAHAKVNNDVLRRQDSCNHLIADFESERLPRVQRIHEDQSVRAESQSRKLSRWNQEFKEWVYAGV